MRVITITIQINLSQITFPDHDAATVVGLLHERVEVENRLIVEVYIRSKELLVITVDQLLVDCRVMPENALR